MMDIFAWIKQSLAPVNCTSDRFIYDDMESQSGMSLPIIYVPFDAGDKGHWRDRGDLYDYLYSTRGEGKRLLDFGPGDGWPSLIVAPFAAEVTGVDGSSRRVEACSANARHLGMTNAHFIHVPPASPLPFDDGTFDGAMAASSVEQSPDPKSTLRELFRVLKSGGRLRIFYEALNGYRGEQERDVWLESIDERTCRLILYDRHIDRECVEQYGITCTLPARELTEIATAGGQPLAFDHITVAFLEKIRSAITDVRMCTTVHPSGRTLVAWMREIGFGEIIPTHCGRLAAGRLFDLLAGESRPHTLEQVDEYLRPIIKTVVELRAPLELDPMITAVK